MIYEVDAQGAFTRLFDQAPEGLLRHPATHLLIGFGHREGEGFRYTFFDDVAYRAWSAISRAYPDGNPSLSGWSTDMRKAVILTQGPTDPGTYHLVDLDARRADVIGEAYPGIRPEQVAEMRPISYAAGDGMTIPGYLTLPPGREARDLPLVVLPHGGPAARDYLGFDWWAQALASRGYAVLQPNFRGSDGLGQAHLEAGYGEWGRKMQSDLSDGVRNLAEQGLIDPERVCIVGASLWRLCSLGRSHAGARRLSLRRLGRRRLGPAPHGSVDRRSARLAGQLGRTLLEPLHGGRAPRRSFA